VGRASPTKSICPTFTQGASYGISQFFIHFLQTVDAPQQRPRLRRRRARQPGWQFQQRPRQRQQQAWQQERQQPFRQPFEQVRKATSPVIPATWNKKQPH